MGYKYLLSPDEMDDDNLYTLARRSVAKTMQIPVDQVRSYDAKDCSGATASAAKKVLLIMRVERELGVDFNEAESVAIKTIGQLAEAVAEKLEPKR